MRYSMFSLMLAAIIVSGCKPPAAPVQKPPAPAPVVDAGQSWKDFTAVARLKCESDPGCTLDYEKLHEYEGHYYGAMIIGYKDSEYYLNLYRFDPKEVKWVDSPRSTSDVGYEDVDVPASSDRWGVPREVIQGWIDEADKTVKEVYSKRAST